MIDAGVMGPPHFTPDVPREHVFAAAGTSSGRGPTRRRSRPGHRGGGTRGADRRATCRSAGDVDGILGLGGSAGTTIGTAAMRALPFGVPKLMVSTLASGQVTPYVGVRDILMMHSVVDISGLNRISRTVLTNAANAMIGMVQAPARQVAEAGSVGRQTADRRHHVRRHHALRRGGAASSWKQAGYEVLVFHATGTGGMTMESFIARRPDRAACST